MLNSAVQGVVSKARSSGNRKATWLRSEDAFADKVRAMLEDGGAVATAAEQIGVAYRVRPQQVEYATLVARTLARATLGQRGRSTLLDAEGGIGKSLGYLLPLALHAVLTGRTGVVSTHTLSLQAQILENDAKLVAAAVEIALGVEPVFAPRRGRQAFLSPSRVNAILVDATADGSFDREDLTLLKDLAAFAVLEAPKPGGALIDAWLQERGVEVLPAGLIPSMVCLERDSPEEEQEQWRIQNEATSGADVALVTHAYALTAARFRARILPDSETEIGGIVFDEADQLNNTAEMVFSGAVSPRAVAMRAERLLSALPPASASRLSRAADTVRTDHAALASALDSLRALGPNQPGWRDISGRGACVIPREATGAVSSVIAATERLAKSLAPLVDRAAKVEARGGQSQALGADLRRDMRDMSEFAGLLREQSEQGGGTQYRVCAVEWSPRLSLPRMRIVPLRGAWALNRLWKEGEVVADACVFTSATLASPALDGQKRWFDFMRDVGIRGGEQENGDLHAVLEAPTGYGRVQFFCADPSAPLPSRRLAATETNDEEEEVVAETDPEWLRYAASVTAAAARFGKWDRSEVPGSVLVLALSFADAEAIGDLVRATPDLKDRLIVHGRGGSARETQQRFRDLSRAGKAPILITPSAWEAVDLPGIIDHLVVTRLPFSPPRTAAERSARMTYRTESATVAKDCEFIANRNAMLRRLRQGIMRLIRRPSDKGRIWFADSRLPPPVEQQAAGWPPHKRAKASYLAVIPRRFRRAWERAQVVPMPLAKAAAAGRKRSAGGRAPRKAAR